jgi:transketolase
MRRAFIDELCLAAENDPLIALVVGDLGYGLVETFAKKFPNQFFNAGVAEQNMMGLSAGLASEGYKVFAYSIANFPTFRCAEQIRNDIDYHKFPVTIVAVGGGLSYGALGYSHHAVQDLALMRIMPNMLIATPGDPLEVRACMRYIIKNPQPSYLRLAKAGEALLHNSIPKVEPGKWLNVKKSKSQNTFLTVGGGLALVFDQVNKIEKLQNYSIYSMPLWGMQSKKHQSYQAENFSKIITVEDHLIDGGFGSWLIESLLPNKANLNKVNIKSLHPDICGMVGTASALILKSGLLEDWD